MFLGLVPVVAVALALVVPGVRRLAAVRTASDSGGRGLVVAAAGAALGVTAVSWAGQHPDALGAVVAVVRASRCWCPRCAGCCPRASSGRAAASRRSSPRAG